MKKFCERQVERIEFAAIRLPDHRLYWSPIGHFDCISRAMDDGVDLTEFEEGFLTTSGRYVDREEAYSLSVAAGQVNPDEPAFRRPTQSGAKELSSEDVDLPAVMASLQSLFPGPVLQERARLAAIRAGLASLCS